MHLWKDMDEIKDPVLWSQNRSLSHSVLYFSHNNTVQPFLLYFIYQLPQELHKLQGSCPSLLPGT